MQAVEEYHAVRLVLRLQLSEKVPGQPWTVQLRAEKRVGTCGGLPSSVCRSVPITGESPVMVAAIIFRLVYDVDKDCGSMWKQGQINFP